MVVAALWTGNLQNSGFFLSRPFYLTKVLNVPLPLCPSLLPPLFFLLIIYLHECVSDKYIQTSATFQSCTRFAILVEHNDSSALRNAQ